MTDNAEDLLIARGAETVPHPGGTLLDHLRRVSGLLAGWGAGPDLVRAGLCHACYGTDGFGAALLELSDRDRLVAAAGAGTEAIVYLYAACDRAATYPVLATGGPLTDRFTGRAVDLTDVQRHELAELTAANELDLAAVNPDVRARYGPGLYRLLTGFAPLLSEPARRHTEAVLGG